MKSEVNLHWLNYLIPGIWAFLCTPSFFMSAFSGASDSGPSAFFILILGYGPLTYVFLKNKTKAYVLTNERLYIEEGIISKSKRDVPLDKINDFEMSQGLIQRMFGAGSVRVLTGNSYAAKIHNVDKVEEFREEASRLVSTRKAS